ncbi:MAG: hypothetical protein M1820_002322 [Bogoriella megaspora]|nr:MAG: hypothetical protein M1820_002322 [Bogoriella megaspora]
MVRILAALAVAAVVSLCDASPTHSSHVLHEKREITHPRWVKRSRIHPEATLPMRIGLSQSNLDRGMEYLMDVSHPSSPNYGKHWTTEQVADAFAPSEETIERVREWLASSGISSNRIAHSDNKGWFAFHASVNEAENLLRTKYHEYEDTETGHSVPACEEYHVPKAIQKHIDYITPGVELRAPNRAKEGHPNLSKRDGSPLHEPIKLAQMPANIRVDNGSLATCDVAITPACIRALYQVPLPPATAQPGNSYGIFEDGDFYAQEDLDLFFANYTPNIPQGTHPTLNGIDGATAPVSVTQAGGESALDFELAFPLLYPQEITLFQTDDINYSNGNLSTVGIYNDWLDAIDGSYCNYSAFGETGNDPVLDPTYPDPLPNGYKGQLQCGVYQPTNVFSISYSSQEYDKPEYYQRRQCNEYMKLGLQGHSIFFSSGDTGVAGRPASPPPNGCLGPDATIFNPRYPDSCPYLTVVGATKVYAGFTVFDPESAANDLAGQPYRTAYSTGGGFSNLYSPPPWQQGAIDTYFSEHNPPYPYYSGNDSLGANGGLYNRSGRGYPDVSANGDNIAVVAGGRPGRSGGTSASTPIFASIVTRINAERLAAGKGPVGFISPALYAHPEVLNDIKNGSNPGCNTNGFDAVEGWDPLTGLGTPNYPKMLDLFLSLP